MGITNATYAQELCIELSCFQGKFNITIEDNSSSSCNIYDSQHSTNNIPICILVNMLHIDKECAETYSLLVKAEGELLYERPILEISGINY